MLTRSRFQDLAIAFLIAAVLFCVFFHPAILNPHDVGWLLRGTDNGENALGLHAG